MGRFSPLFKRLQRLEPLPEYIEPWPPLEGSLEWAILRAERQMDWRHRQSPPMNLDSCSWQGWRLPGCGVITTSRIDHLMARLLELEDNAHAGRIHTTSADGQRAWIEGGGCGLSFLRNLTKGMRDNEIPGDLRQLCDLWSRAEVDGPKFGEIARMCRDQARRAMEGE